MMKPVEEYIVPWVREAESYSDKHLEFAWSHPDVVRMMSNENPLEPPQSVLDAIMEMARRGNLYPNTGPRLRQKLGEAAGLGADNVMLGNGSTDVLNVLIQTFVAPGEEVVIAVPTFSMYETRARVNGAVPVLVPMSPAPDFYWDVDGIIDAVTEKTKLIFICTPNNPTGNEMDESDLRRVLDLGVPTLIDEAYYELEDEPHTLSYLIKEYPNAIINRTFSKAYGLAGLRVGYALANETVISYMNRMKIPWNVSLIALAAALAAVEDEEDQRLKYENNQKGRRYLFEEINHIPGLEAYPSEGNFVLIDASALGKTSVQIKDDLIARGVFIRPMSPHHMKEGYVRVTVGTPEQNRMFIEKLRAYVAEVGIV
jgi:histidinol-phosphate aminotransferase